MQRKVEMICRLLMFVLVHSVKAGQLMNSFNLSMNLHQESTGCQAQHKKGKTHQWRGQIQPLPHQCPTSSVSLFKVAVFLVKFSSDSWNRLSDTKISIKEMGDPWKTSICKTKRTCLQLKCFFISCTGARSWAGTQFIILSTYLLGLT